MVIHAQRELLYDAARKVAKASPKVNVAEARAGIHMEADESTSSLILTAANNELAMRATLPVTVEAGGSLVMDPAMFLGMLDRLPDETAHIELLEHNIIKITSGATQYRYQVQPGDKFPLPELPFPDDMVPLKGVCSLARNTLFAVSEDEARPSLGCVKLVLSQDGLRAIACNGYCVAEAKGDKECVGATSVLMPGRSLKLLASISKNSDVYDVGLTGKDIVFWDGVLLFSARVMDTEFLDTDKVFNSLKTAYTVQVDVEKLRAGIMTVTAMGAHQDRLELRTQGRYLHLTCEVDRGLSQLDVEAVAASDLGRPMYFNYLRLLAQLRHLRGTVDLEFSTEGHLVIRTDAGRFLLMAINPPRQAAGADAAA